jgi:hypothetical protein
MRTGRPRRLNLLQPQLVTLLDSGGSAMRILAKKNKQGPLNLIAPS